MKRKLKICVLDDEPIVGDRLQPELESDGHEVEVFTDGSLALARVDETCFDIVITDLKMEGVDGMSFLEKVKEKCPFTQVIMISGYATIENARESFVKGAFDFVAKPFRFTEIRDAVKRAGSRVGRNQA